MVLKLIALLKRKPGMSLEEFRDYYESTHSKFADALKGGKVERYVRRYFQSIQHAMLAEQDEAEFDAMNEMWFKDEAQFRAAMALFSEPSIGQAIKADEYNLFDVSKIRHYLVDEVDTDLS